MGLLDFFSRKDPTHDWPTPGAATLRFDVTRGELNGIAFGAGFDSLRAFGKPDNERPLRARLFAYAPLGLSVVLGVDTEVLLFTGVFQAGADGESGEFPDFSPCRISLQGERGTLLEVTDATSVGMVERALGPLSREETADEAVFSTTLGGTWLGFTFDLDGQLMLLDIEPGEDGSG